MYGDGARAVGFRAGVPGSARKVPQEGVLFKHGLLALELCDGLMLGLLHQPQYPLNPQQKNGLDVPGLGQILKTLSPKPS